jgi:formylglycine-generating enzyme required for sulfatase activity
MTRPELQERAARNFRTPDLRQTFYGFRCAVDP